MQCPLAISRPEQARRDHERNGAQNVQRRVFSALPYSEEHLLGLLCKLWELLPQQTTAAADGWKQPHSV